MQASTSGTANAVPDAEVAIFSLQRRVFTKSDGTFLFTDIALRARLRLASLTRDRRDAKNRALASGLSA